MSPLDILDPYYSTIRDDASTPNIIQEGGTASCGGAIHTEARDDFSRSFGREKFAMGLQLSLSDGTSDFSDLNRHSSICPLNCWSSI
mmetsp:Transcript_39167/g.47419  ORF Transcript_39167/g.47419 Transcript_39167/m.47419 type:complete len:87 (+) Transcript_39167:763-1023(+)